MRTFSGPARIFESQEEAMRGIMAGEVQPGEVVVIRYEGPQGRSRHEGNAQPDQRHHGHGPGRAGGPDHRRALFRRARAAPASGMSRRKRPQRGPIAALQAGDVIEIDLEARTLECAA